MDERVKAKLHDLMAHTAIVDVNSVKAQLKDFVQTCLFTRATAPPTSNKKFYPTHQTIYNHMYLALAETL